MTYDQRRAIAPLLPHIREVMEIFLYWTENDHIMPAVHLEFPQWRRILEAFDEENS